ncbi:response regulator [Asticcacaulis solisilvae]|uniref:response regulator n=1 Tax=Asticcacaulis solisilvae TaxID=1217274 RepID=UPI003FD83816
MLETNAVKKSLVLLVDDSPDMGLVVKYMLELIGFDVERAWDGRVAVERSHATCYGAILMDIEMPEMDGLEAAKAIRQRERTDFLSPVPIVAMTSHASKGIKALCLHAGMDEVLMKPFLVAQLEEKMLRVCGKLPDSI